MLFIGGIVSHPDGGGKVRIKGRGPNIPVSLSFIIIGSGFPGKRHIFYKKLFACTFLYYGLQNISENKGGVFSEHLRALPVALIENLACVVFDTRNHFRCMVGAAIG